MKDAQNKKKGNTLSFTIKKNNFIHYSEKKNFFFVHLMNYLSQMFKKMVDSRNHNS